jgi:hypothetical protein
LLLICRGGYISSISTSTSPSCVGVMLLLVPPLSPPALPRLPKKSNGQVCALGKGNGVVVAKRFARPRTCSMRAQLRRPRAIPDRLYSNLGVTSHCKCSLTRFFLVITFPNVRIEYCLRYNGRTNRDPTLPQRVRVKHGLYIRSARSTISTLFVLLPLIQEDDNDDDVFDQ